MWLIGKTEKRFRYNYNQKALLISTRG